MLNSLCQYPSFDSYYFELSLPKVDYITALKFSIQRILNARKTSKNCCQRKKNFEVKEKDHFSSYKKFDSKLPLIIQMLLDC